MAAQVIVTVVLKVIQDASDKLQFECLGLKVSEVPPSSALEWLSEQDGCFNQNLKQVESWHSFTELIKAAEQKQDYQSHPQSEELNYIIYSQQVTLCINYFNKTRQLLQNSFQQLLVQSPKQSQGSKVAFWGHLQSSPSNFLQLWC